jgi:hypothetical protein
MADLKNLLRQEAAQGRRLAELVTEQTIRQALMEMTARLEAIAPPHAKHGAPSPARTAERRRFDASGACRWRVSRSLGQT